MSWASRRRTTYLTGVFLFFLFIIGGPIAYWYFSIPPTCFDGIQNQGETAVDEGGPCLKLDPNSLQPNAILWDRSFRVRDGSYNAIAYIDNPNQGAGVATAQYRFELSDAQNVLVAERDGTTFIMPGGITPVFEGAIDTGNRIVAHTSFCFVDNSGNCDSTDASLDWDRMTNAALSLSINNKQLLHTDTVPQLSAIVENTSVADVLDPSFVAVVFDSDGNAFAASATRLDRLSAGSSTPIVFTWPDPFQTQASQIDIIPLLAPVAAPAQ
jgi:hypothetical protein